MESENRRSDTHGRNWSLVFWLPLGTENLLSSTALTWQARQCLLLCALRKIILSSICDFSSCPDLTVQSQIPDVSDGLTSPKSLH